MRFGLYFRPASLEGCDPEDTVVISFSGHGSDTHELVTFDAGPHDLSGTAVPLEELAAWFGRIPARRLILLLDCCFSGGIGAKVLHAPAVPRRVESAEAQLTGMSGEGRIIITASSANEPAWENARVGQGYFTHFLIEALQGVEGVAEDGRCGRRLLAHLQPGAGERHPWRADGVGPRRATSPVGRRRGR
jgi:helicase